jgi:hypothetical protein
MALVVLSTKKHGQHADLPGVRVGVNIFPGLKAGDFQEGAHAASDS